VSTVLKTLCDLNGTSGNEAAVRDYILEQIQPYCTTCSVDELGSVIAFKKGKRTPEKRVMLSAHMDEVGFIITGATEEGYLQFAPVGGINPSVVLGRRLALENGGYGMVGTVPIHLLHEDAGEKVPSFDELLIDVGAADKQTAEAIAPVGSFAYFSESYVAFGDGKICAKALDDRIGCMLMIELLQSELEADTWFCFQVQEEVGLRGAACTGSRVQPDRVLVLEATTAADLDGVTGDKRVCVLGDGPVVSFMDGATIYDRALYRMARETADENGIPNQTKTAIAGGNDAGALQRSGQGSAALAVSLPCRYIHSGASVVQQSDIDATRALLAALLPKLYD
jgi:peptidase M42 family protein